MAGLRLLLYVSYLAEASGQPDVAAIVRESWKNSERDDVSGLLVFDGSRFAQFLEGPEAAMQHRAAASKATIDTAISRGPGVVNGRGLPTVRVVAYGLSEVRPRPLGPPRASRGAWRRGHRAFTFILPTLDIDTGRAHPF